MSLPNCVPQEIYQPDEDITDSFGEIDDLDLFEIDKEMRMITKLENEVKGGNYAI